MPPRLYSHPARIERDGQSYAADICPVCDEDRPVFIGHKGDPERICARCFSEGYRAGEKRDALKAPRVVHMAPPDPVTSRGRDEAEETTMGNARAGECPYCHKPKSNLNDHETRCKLNPANADRAPRPAVSPEPNPKPKKSAKAPNGRGDRIAAVVADLIAERDKLNAAIEVLQGLHSP